ncbi:putative B3 domain-containing protein REM15 [Chenopodium quinoa]|uniref:putative B3 domain-containing protein REM15 n=1 Tax=Chenopodium quinoa TaxID=63459 RepID=UPI000B77833F|nr:putative B3 domain-containing protein REM15 [Chenopodium quinoa]
MHTTKISEEPNSNNGAKFMQPLIPGFLNTFSIPVSYMECVEMELHGHQPEGVALVTDDNHHWAVKLEGGRRFGDGWKEFCEHNELSVGNFLVFTHISKLIFSVTVYDPTTACARQFSNGIEKRGNPMEEDDAATAQVPSAESKYPTYNVTLSPTVINKGQAYLPKGFVKSSGLLNRQCYMKLIDGKGKAWTVMLKYKKSNGQSYIGQGWKDFQIANGLKLGHNIVFQFLQDGEMPVLKCFQFPKSP